MPYRKTVLIGWQTAGSRRACFFVRPGSRSRPWIWFRDCVPEFEGQAARFVVEKRAGRWVAVEKLEA
mgnify:CR=1 FL=1|jgi:hypothetical protein